MTTAGCQHWFFGRHACVSRGLRGGRGCFPGWERFDSRHIPAWVSVASGLADGSTCIGECFHAAMELHVCEAWGDQVVAGPC